MTVNSNSPQNEGEPRKGVSKLHFNPNYKPVTQAEVDDGLAHISPANVAPEEGGYPLHSDYVRMFNNAQISVMLQKGVACQFCDKLIARGELSDEGYQPAKVWFKFHLFVALFPWFIVSWGWALTCSLALVIYSFAFLLPKVKEHARAKVIGASLSNKQVYRELLQANMMAIRKKDGEWLCLPKAY